MPELIIIATKDNKVKLVNIDKGESYKSIDLGIDSNNTISSNNSNISSSSFSFPIEMLVLERENKPRTSCLIP